MPRRRASTVVTLTLNPAVDLWFSVDRMVAGPKLRCHDVRRDPGGGGVNVARVIRRLGGKALAMVAAGGAAGAELEAMLRRERVPAMILPIAGDTREDVTAEDRSTGAEYRFVMPGPSLRPRESSAFLAAVEGLDPAPGILVASGSLPAGAATGLYRRIATWARERGVKFALDASGKALREGLAAGVWLAKPNLAELEALHGGPLPDTQVRLVACRAIVDHGGAQIVALSMGDQGALVVSRTEAWHAKAPKVRLVSTIGAGDSFTGGLIHALAAGLPVSEALRWAVAAGTATLLTPGTGLCRTSDVGALCERVRPAPIPMKRTARRPRTAQDAARRDEKGTRAAPHAADT